MSLRSKVIRLAHSRPELRPVLLPLLQETRSAGWFQSDSKMAVAEVERAVKALEKLEGSLAGVIQLLESDGLDYGHEIMDVIRRLRTIPLDDLARRLKADVDYIK